MPCACGSKRIFSQVGSDPVAADAGRTNTIGMYDLASYPDCTEPYSGSDGRRGIFIVARGRPEERLFVDADAVAAANYAKEVNAPFVRVPARSLCDTAVRDLLAEQVTDQQVTL